MRKFCIFLESVINDQGDKIVFWVPVLINLAPNLSVIVSLASLKKYIFILSIYRGSSELQAPQSFEIPKYSSKPGFNRQDVTTDALVPVVRNSTQNLSVIVSLVSLEQNISILRTYRGLNKFQASEILEFFTYPSKPGFDSQNVTTDPW